MGREPPEDEGVLALKMTNFKPIWCKKGQFRGAKEKVMLAPTALEWLITGLWVLNL